jgi:thiamine transport system substrate-binding protein
MTDRQLRSTPLAGSLLLAALLGLGCAPAGSSPSPGQLVLVTHEAFAVSDGVLAKFQQDHGATVQVLKAGDAGAMVNQAILTKDAPLADVLYGVDNTFLSRALDAGIFQPYHSPLLDTVPQNLQLDDQERVTPIDYGDVCLNYDRSAFSPAAPPPARLEDLTQAAFRGKLVVENPATSSPGLAFLLATVARFGESGDHTWRDYWSDLRANDVMVENDWNTAYYTAFSGGAGEGDRPIVVSYATSPAAEVVYADPPVTEAPTAVVTDGCFRQVEFAAVLTGARSPQLAQAFLDFMLSTDFQQDIPLNMFVFPANQEAVVPTVFADNSAVVRNPISMAAETISANRDRWVGEWTDVVLH